MFRAVVRLFGHWGVTDEQAAKLLDLGLRTYGRWKAGDVGRIGRDGKARLSNLMGIHKALRIIFSEPARGSQWIGAPNDALGVRSALDVMQGGDLPNLMPCRSYHDSTLHALISRLPTSPHTPAT